MENKQEQRKDNLNEQEQETGANQPQQDEQQKGGIHNNALYAASMARPATAAVNQRNASGWATTGTNPSYDEPIAAGGGGSVGTGFASGQSATGITTTQTEDYDKAGIVKGRENKEDNENEEDKKENP
jgi:hypothetical protein